MSSNRNGIQGLWEVLSALLIYVNYPPANSGSSEWAKKGIVNRGVLIDYMKFAEESGLRYDPWFPTVIPLATVEEIACQVSYYISTRRCPPSAYRIYPEV